MTRQQELEQLLNKLKDDETRALVQPAIKQVVFLESQLDILVKMPFIKVSKNDPTKQKTLAAQRVYVSLLQQYNLLIKMLSKIATDNGIEELSPLRAYLEGMNK